MNSTVRRSLSVLGRDFRDHINNSLQEIIALASTLELAEDASEEQRGLVSHIGRAAREMAGALDIFERKLRCAVLESEADD